MASLFYEQGGEQGYEQSPEQGDELGTKSFAPSEQGGKSIAGSLEVQQSYVR
jgi:hypothetical protein